jgi:hypothetical protein
VPTVPRRDVCGSGPRRNTRERLRTHLGLTADGAVGGPDAAGMARPDQLRHATQVLARAWILRGALKSAPATIGEQAMSYVPTIPLTCRLNLRHKWQMTSTEDGSNHYWVCAICGKDKPNRMSSLKGVGPP